MSSTHAEQAATTTAAGFERENHRRLVSWFELDARGAAAQEGKQLGVEVEHFIVTDDGKPVGYEPAGGVIGVRNVLEHLSRTYPRQTRNAHGDLLGLANDTGSVTLEPAAQIEISLATYERIADIEASYRAFRSALDPFLNEHGCRIAEAGYHPAAQARDLKLIPKERYRFMDAHFAQLGTHGERMMRASASTQVSIDYADESDAVRKLRVAASIGPVLAAITDNVHTFEGAPTRSPLARMALWRDVDDARCGTIPGLFDESFGFDAYARWIERISPIFVTRPAANDPTGPTLRGFSDTPTSVAYDDAPLAESDIEHVLSMVWPDVRLKQFVEIRPADCMPEPCILGYAALIKGLFYCEESLSAAEELIGVRNGCWPLDNSSVDRVISRIRTSGFDAEVYGHTLRLWEAVLFELAEAALEPGERAYLKPLQAFAADKPWK